MERFVDHLTQLREQARGDNPEQVLAALSLIRQQCEGVAGDRVFNETKRAVVEAAVSADSRHESTEDIQAIALEILVRDPDFTVRTLIAEALGEDVTRAKGALSTLVGIEIYTSLSAQHVHEILDAALRLEAHPDREIEFRASNLKNAMAHIVREDG